jgi:hypothetical protein
MTRHLFAVKRILAIVALFILVALYASAAYGDGEKSERIQIATTAFITRIDLKNNLFKVRSSTRLAQPNVRIPTRQERNRGWSAVILPTGVTIRLPVSADKEPVNKNAEDVLNSGTEYIVTLTEATVLSDGYQPIKLENFEIGERISIHGTFNGTNLTATRISKWPK